MRRTSAEGYALFRRVAGLVTKRYKALVVLWILAFLGAVWANQVWRVGDVVSFEQSASLPQDTESAQAQRLLDDQFPGIEANSTATIVLVADGVTSQEYRWFVADLHDAIVAAAGLGPGDTATLTLRNGGDLNLNRRISYLRDPGSATVYAVLESFAYGLARELNGPVHENITFVQAATGIYWGLPSAFLQVWALTPEPSSNATAYSATRDAVNASFPATARAWPEGYVDTWYAAWRGSFFDPNLTALPPSTRAEAVVGNSVPAFLNSSLGLTLFPDPNARLFQLGLLGTFDLSTFADPALHESYAIGTFSQVPFARPAFFQDLVDALDANSTDADIRAFADAEALRYPPAQTPLVLPVNVTQFYVSADDRITLMNYAFDRDADFVDADRTQPIVDAVFAMRAIVSSLRAEYGAAGAAARVYVTGSAPSSVDSELTFGGGEEFVVTIVLVIVLIGLYFRSPVSPALPIVTIGIAIMIANLFVYVVARYLLTVDFTVTAVLQTVLLATGTDYSIFLVSRYRDERRDGRDRPEAARNAVIWAGESVTTSGGAVLISFAALSLGSFPVVRTMGLTLGFAVTTALALALTFIPAIVMLAGDRVFWPSGRRLARPRPKGELSRTERYFQGAARFSMRHAKAILAAAILITVPATYVVVTDQPTYDFTAGSPPTESSEGLDAIADSFGHGFLFPTVIVVRFPGDVLLPDGNVSVPRMDALRAFEADVLVREPGVVRVEGPTNPQGGAVDYRNLSSMREDQRRAVVLAMDPYIGRDNRTVRLDAVLRDEPFSREALETIDRLGPVLASLQASEPELLGAEIRVGGVSAILNDVRDNMNRDLQIMAVVVITGLFIVLLFVLGSVLIPIRAILTILLSIAWTMGLTITLFHWWRGIDIIFLLPLALFVMAMGLGMDYDIFIITRVREEVAKGKTDPEAITEATTRTGGIISACGIVMAGAFATLMLNPSPFLQEIGFALAFAILLDSMVVRIYLVPAIMVLAGKYNWWAPGRLQRVRLEEKAAAQEARRARKAVK